MTKRLKILTVVGARPQFIKASTISRLLGTPLFSSRIVETIVHTGQHYDNAMSEAFFKGLQIPPPAYNLSVGSASHGAQTGAIMERLEPVVLKERPDLVLVYGDTNSTLAAALLASKIPVDLAHIEAGLRSYRRGMPEEVNRVVTDHLSDWLFCSSNVGRDNLAKEGLSEGVLVVGDIMYDGFVYEAQRTDSEQVLREFGLKAGGFALVTVHRAENTDDKEKLRALVTGLSKLSKKIQVVFPIHPRTRSAIDCSGLSLPEGCCMIEPQPYSNMVALTSNAGVVVTDSGGLQKEAYFAGTRCVTLRDETEWIETLQAGWNRLVPATEFNDLAYIVVGALEFDTSEPPPLCYGDGNSAQSILETLLAR